MSNALYSVLVEGHVITDVDYSVWLKWFDETKGTITQMSIGEYSGRVNFSGVSIRGLQKPLWFKTIIAGHAELSEYFHHLHEAEASLKRCLSVLHSQNSVISLDRARAKNSLPKSTHSAW